MSEALFWGLLAAGSLLVGQALARRSADRHEPSA